MQRGWYGVVEFFCVVPNTVTGICLHVKATRSSQSVYYDQLWLASYLDGCVLKVCSSSCRLEHLQSIWEV